MRSQLRHVVQDQVGNVRAGLSIEVFDFGTTTPISNSMYPSATSVVVLNPNTLVTNTLGEIELWIAGLSAPVDIRIGGVLGVTETVYFVPDPATLALASALPSAILTTQGDIIVAGSAGAPGRFGIGTAFQELVVNAGATALQYANGVLARAAAAGDTFYATGVNAIAKLAKGTAFQEMTMNSGATAPQWSDGVLALAAAAGDIFQATGANAIAKLSLGTARFNLAVNAAGTAVEYVASIQSLITAAGDLVVGSAANTAVRLAKGANGTYLGVVGGALTWTTGTAVRNQIGSAVGSTSDPTTNSTSYVDMTDMSVTLTTTGGDLLVHFTGTFTANIQNITMALRLDSGSDVCDREVTIEANGNRRIGAMTHTFTSVSAASHTVKARWKQAAGGTITAVGVQRELVVMES